MTNAKKPDISAAELELKRRGRRRLIGAVTLGLLAIVILPMVFDSVPKSGVTGAQAPKQEIAINIPPKDGLPPVAEPTMPAGMVAPAPVPVPAPLVTGADAAKVPSGGVADKPGAVAPPKKTALAEPPVESKPDAKTAAVPAPAAPTIKAALKPSQEITAAPKAVAKNDPKAASKADRKAEQQKEGFVVQIGAYKDADNAKSIVAQMKDAKLPVFTDTIAVKTGNVTRVRVGPYATKSKAESALVQVKLAGGDGKVVALH